MRSGRNAKVCPTTPSIATLGREDELLPPLLLDEELLLLPPPPPPPLLPALPVSTEKIRLGGGLTFFSDEAFVMVSVSSCRLYSDTTPWNTSSFNLTVFCGGNGRGRRTGDG